MVSTWFRFGDRGLDQPHRRADILRRARITVPAGTFDVRHYRIRPAHYPPLDLWVIPGDFLFVRLAWDYLGTRYDLAELARD